MKISKINPMKIPIFILMFFVLGALLIISNNNLAIYRQGSFENFFGLYVEWINQIYKNIQILTGDVARLYWLP